MGQAEYADPHRWREGGNHPFDTGLYYDGDSRQNVPFSRYNQEIPQADL